MKRAAGLLKLAFGLCCLLGGVLLFLGCAVITCVLQLSPRGDAPGALTINSLATLAVLGVVPAAVGLLITLANWPRDPDA
jgi:hypothetical protein